MTYQDALIQKNLYGDIKTVTGKVMKVFIIPECPVDFKKYLLAYAYLNFDDAIVHRYSSNQQYKLYYREVRALM